MTKWTTLRARFSEEELEEIERIKNKYDLSYNEIIRSAVKFYISLTVAKELFAETLYGKDILIHGKDLGKILQSSDSQANLEQKATKLIKAVLFELFEKGVEFKERTRPIRKQRKVGRPKKQRTSGKS